MCGINGFIDPSLSTAEARSLLNEMLDVTHHRGPDSRGVFQHEQVHLGHNRLSIIDLRSESDQPFIDEELSLVFNGEIYNYLEIRAELEKSGHRFRTDSDTEVLLRSFREWGIECVQRFIGMWAFAIYDSKEETLFASRDRFGIKPFHYISDSGKFYFSSELKALKKSPAFRPEVNARQVALGLQLGMVYHDDETYWTCARNLPGGHNLIYKDGELRVWRYWDIESYATDKRSFKEKTEEFQSLFLDTIRLHLRSDVPLGTCLSGGLDSSSIASSVCHLFPDQKLHTFSVFYDEAGYDERKWMREVVQKYPQIEPHYFSPDDDQLIAHLDDFLYTQEVPIAGSSPFSQYFLMKLAHDTGVKVTLDGQGADEYLIGYMHAFPRLIADHIRRMRFGAAIQESKDHKRVSEMGSAGYKDLWVKSLASAFIPENKLTEIAMRKANPWLLRDHYTADEPVSEAPNRTYALHHTLTFHSTLPTLLHYADRNSMAFSIESRVPFLDHRLVESAYRMQTADHVRHGVTKSVLRESMKDILPKAIVERRDKVAFKTPGDIRWLRGPLSHLLRPADGLFDLLERESTQRVIDRFSQGDDSQGRLVWRLAMLNYWLEKN